MCAELTRFLVFCVSVVVRVHGWMVQRRVPGCPCVNAQMPVVALIPHDLGHF